MSAFNDFVSTFLPHDGYSSVGEAAKAFFMPGAYSADKTNESNRQLAAEQNETNWKRYLYDNAYNSPVAQIQRMRAAGLNPAMMYEGGGSIATSTPPPNAVENRDIAPDMTGMPTLSNVIQFAQQQSLIDAQTHLMESQANKTEAETKTENEIRDKRINEILTSIEEMKSRIDGMKIDSQLKSIQYLRDSLSYSLEHSTFSDAVSQIHEGLEGTRLANKYSRFQLERGLSLLPLEIVGYNLNNNKIRSAIQLDKQQWRLTEDMFDDIKELKHFELKNSKLEYSIKELQMWIDGLDNPQAFSNYLREKGAYNKDGKMPYTSDFDDWMFKSLERMRRVLNSLNPLKGLLR